ncbi:hypothetical protein L218DRAFT_998554 [Marasmius fiardii PR-910]|nr:hypothetical protein L218DRAFT_998554 [Marasmius fiardii PR-910]
MHKSSPPRSSSSRHLKQGKACLTCRFLKFKCDGARPICGPCQRHPKDDPCEYADGPGRSRTRVLEDTVSRLEARLREYENPDETPSMALHSPYSTTPSEAQSLHLSVPSMPFGEPISSHASPSSPFASLSPMSAPSPPFGRSAISPTRTVSSKSAELSLPVIRKFSTFGFFLDLVRFYSSALIQKPPGDPSRPTSGLLRTVYLLGTHLSTALQSTEAQPGREHSMLILALRETATDLTTTHPKRLIHTIQAETLLSYYFFRTGNIIEAKRHASSAASLVLACGFHRVHSTSSSTWGSSSSTVAVGPSGSTPLPESRDSVEEGEKINGFWTVFTLYRNLAAAVNSSSDVCGVFDAPGLQVDAPWPLDMESYKEGVLPPAGTSTVWNYLNHVPSHNEEYERSADTFVAKTSILFHQAVFLASQYNPDSQGFIAAFQSLDHLLETTRAQLGPPPNDITNTTRSLCLSYALLHGATIKLHSIFSYSDAASRQACVDAAKAMFRTQGSGGVDMQRLGCVNPIMGTLWTLGCQVLIEEVVRIRQGWPGEAESLKTRLHEGISTLNFFAASSGLMSEYVQQVRRLYPDYRWPTMSVYDLEERSSPPHTPSFMGTPFSTSDWSPHSELSSLEGDGSDPGSSSGNYRPLGSNTEFLQATIT